MVESARAITTAPAHPLRFYNKHGPTLVVHRPPHQEGGAARHSHHIREEAIDIRAEALVCGSVRS